MPVGTVKYVNADKGYGFISRENKEPKVFLHVSEVQKAGVKTIEKGQRWIFDIVTAADGRKSAANLRIEGIGDPLRE